MNVSRVLAINNVAVKLKYAKQNLINRTDSSLHSSCFILLWWSSKSRKNLLLNQLYGCSASLKWHRATHHRHVAWTKFFIALYSLLFKLLFRYILWKIARGGHLNRPAFYSGLAATDPGNLMWLSSPVVLLLLRPILYLKPLYHFFHLVTCPWSSSTA